MVDQHAILVKALKRVCQWPVNLCWLYLAVAALAELLIAFEIFLLGQFFHLLLLVALFASVSKVTDKTLCRLTIGLTIMPIIRILSISLPLGETPLIWWYPSIGMPLLITAGLIIHHLGIWPRELGFRCSNLLIEGMIGLSGLALGAYGYALLQPAPLV
ncbi:MAG: hypothetical protein MI924_23525, partial [Chloroflexales bacterium]|nr:hypothetical protein [Chloroflexales bacterium]